MIQSKLFAKLPEYVCTPDGMEIDSEGKLVLACPNYADTSMPGVIVKIDKEGNVTKWFEVPVQDETKCARPMGIAFGPDGDLFICDNQGWSGAPELAFKGRVLRIKTDGNEIVKATVVAKNMEHPNGIRIMGNYAYVTESLMSKVEDETGLLVSGVYRFGLDEEELDISNTLADKHLLATFLTYNKDCQYGADGIVFDMDRNLLVGNFGDGTVYKIEFNEDGSVKSNLPWAKDAAQLQSTDGMIMDDKGNIYIADFSANAVARITPEGKVTRIAQSPDCDGLDGGLDQPGEPIVWNGKIILSCFDLVTGPDKVNTGHELPATLAELDLSSIT